MTISLNYSLVLLYLSRKDTKGSVFIEKRKKKKETKKGFAHATELYGVLLVLAAILGIGRYGPVGNMIASFAIFLVGVFYNV